MSVWTGIWGLGGQQEDVTRSTISKEDMRRLQVLQNKAMRLITKCDRWTPTSTLLEKTSFLSVHQLGAYHTALQVFKTHQTRKPTYHYERLFGRNRGRENMFQMRSSANQVSRVDFKLSTCRSSFFYQGAQLWSALPTEIKNSCTSAQFKVKCREWIRRNIRIRP